MQFMTQAQRHTTTSMSTKAPPLADNARPLSPSPMAIQEPYLEDNEGSDRTPDLDCR